MSACCIMHFVLRSTLCRGVAKFGIALGSGAGHRFQPCKTKNPESPWYTPLSGVLQNRKLRLKSRLTTVMTIDGMKN